MAERIEIRDGREFRVIEIPAGVGNVPHGRFNCFACKKRRRGYKLHKSGVTKNGVRWHICVSCARSYGEKKRAEYNGRIPDENVDAELAHLDWQMMKAVQRDP